MQKIMFDDQYGLTQAVLRGCKTMTRRKETFLGQLDSLCAQLRNMKDSDSFVVTGKTRFKVGEIVAVAQSYNDIYEELKRTHGSSSSVTRDFFHKYIQGGRMPVSNKMFVKAGLMLHQIRITDFNVERLQDISDEDCLKEGVIKLFDSYRTTASDMFFHTAQEAFAALIDRVSGKGTWERNPFVVAYSFELVK